MLKEIRSKDLKNDLLFWFLIGCLSASIYIYLVSPRYNVVKDLGNSTFFISVEYKNLTVNYTYNIVSIFCVVSIPKLHFFYLSGFPLINYTQTVNDLIKKTDPFQQACEP